MRFEDWGEVEYDEALVRQREIFERVAGGGGVASWRRIGGDGVVVFCEHPPVFTLGRNGDEGNILAAEGILRELGAKIIRTDRGGDVTFHGPGQLVCYLIFDLGAMGLREYIWRLEEAVIETLGEFGIAGVRSEKGAGVWVSQESRVSSQESRAGSQECADEIANCRSFSRAVSERSGEGDGKTVAIEEAERVNRLFCIAEDAARTGNEVGGKICAIGVRASRGVVMHGLALNVTTDLGWFGLINPCGMAGEAVARMDADMDEVKEILEEKLKKHILCQ